MYKFINPYNWDEDEKDDFYFYLQVAVNTDKTITGDLNAKVGWERRGRRVIGSHRIVVMNDNGELFCDLCAMNGYWRKFTNLGSTNRR